MTATELTIRLTVPAIEPEFHQHEDDALSTLHEVSLLYVQEAQRVSQAAHDAAKGLDWDTPEHVARLQAAEDAARAWHTLAYVTDHLFGGGRMIGHVSMPAIARPAHLPAPTPAAPRTPFVPSVVSGDEDDRL